MSYIYFFFCTLKIGGEGNSSATTRLSTGLPIILLRRMAGKTRQRKKEKIHTHFYVLLPLIMMRTIQFECQNERINRRGMDIKRGKSKKQDLQQMQYNLNYCLTCEEEKKNHA